MKKLWVICPCYFDVPSFKKLQDEVTATLADQKDIEPNFVLVDDTAGRDPEVPACRSRPHTTTVQAPFNLGHQKAIVYGLRALAHKIGDHDFILTMDSDGEDRPQDTAALVEKLRQFPHDVVLAKRTQRSEGLKFRISYRAYKLFFRLLTGRTIQTGNFAAYSSRTLKSMINHPHFDRCYSMSLFSSKIPTQLVPLPRGTRFFGESKMNMTSLVRHGLNMLMPFLDQISFRGMLLFLMIAVVGFFAGLGIVYIKLFTQLAIPGWTSYALLGVVTLSVGSFGNLLVLFFMYTQMDSHYLMDLLNQENE